MRSQEDHQTGMDHRIACQLLIPCHLHQFALGRGRVQQQDPRATWMEFQMCWASDATRELRMMTRAHGALSLLQENIEMVASKASLRRCETTVSHRCNVSMWHWLKGCLRSWHRSLRSSWQRNTDVLSSLHKIIWIGEVKLLSTAAGRVPWAFPMAVHRGPWTSLLKLACHDRVALAGARRASSIGPSGNCSDCSCVSNVTLAALHCRCSMCQPQRLVLQTNDRCLAVPMCSPLALCLSVASPAVHNVSDLEKLSIWVCTVCSRSGKHCS